MQRLVWCAVVVALGCKGKQDGGSAAGSGPAVGSGSGSAPVAPPVDAAAPDAAVLVDAAVAASPAADKLISDKGVGPITATTPRGSIEKLFPGAKVEREKQESEDTSAEWISVLVDKKLSLKLLVDDNVNSKSPSRVLVDDPAYATASGIKVGSTGADFAAKIADATCKAEKWDEEPLPQLYCEAKSAPQLVFYFETKGQKIKVGAQKLDAIGALVIKEIMWTAPEPAED